VTAASSTPRRTFLKTTAAAVALGQVPFVHAAGNATLRVALIGCGGRGTGAASQALRADPDVKLVALADAFADRLESCLTRLQGEAQIRDKIDVPRERRFVGFDAFQQALNCGVDVVLLCTPPHFRPQHIEAAVQANKHVFAEKPMAVDGPGVRRVLAAAAEARRRHLSLGSGFCWRYHPAMRETVKRIHDGAIGDVQALHCNYLTGALWHRAREKDWTDMEYQMRNWYYYTWLSGDYNVEQHVHSLDKMGWIMKNEYPVRCYGLGGRQVRTGPEFGHIFDHMAVVYEWTNGARCFAMSRQQIGCYGEVTDHIYGTKGQANLLGRGAQTPYTITGENAWRYPAAQDRRNGDMYQIEHNEQFAGIRSGNPINDGDWMAKSTLMAIMGRIACYTGQVVTAEQALNSPDLTPPDGYRWDRAPAMPAVARPGVTSLT
jgi:myo-inositol 2-dehydrogenase / D-chiro-inositol 1-dehydrogenase